jgi:hypothetical protein
MTYPLGHQNDRAELGDTPGERLQAVNRLIEVCRLFRTRVSAVRPMADRQPSCLVMGPGEIFLRFDMDPPRSSVAASQRSCGSACGNVARGRSWPHRQPALGRLIGLRGLARFPSSPIASRWSAICGLMTTYRAAVGRVACRLDARPVGLQPGEVGQLVAHARGVAVRVRAVPVTGARELNSPTHDQTRVEFAARESALRRAALVGDLWNLAAVTRFLPGLASGYEKELDQIHGALFVAHGPRPLHKDSRRRTAAPARCMPSAAPT